jgi:hypothetical protein
VLKTVLLSRKATLKTVNDRKSRMLQITVPITLKALMGHLRFFKNSETKKSGPPPPCFR